MAAGDRNFTSWYIMAVIVSLGVALVTEDKYVGVLLAIALMLWIAGMEQRSKRNKPE